MISTLMKQGPDATKYLNGSLDVWYLRPTVQAVVDDEPTSPLAGPHRPRAVDQHQQLALGGQGVLAGKHEALWL